MLQLVLNCASQTCAPIAAAMHRAASEMLKSLARAEQSMLKLKASSSSNSTASSAAAADSDGAKIRRALDFDVRTLCRSVRAVCFRAYATGSGSNSGLNNAPAENEGESSAADVATSVLGELLALLVAADAKDS